MCRSCHGGDLRLEVLGGEPFLEDDGSREAHRPRAGDGKIVHRSVDRKLADGAAGKADRSYDERVRGERQPDTADGEQAGIGQLLQGGVGQQRNDEPFHECPARLAAGTVGHRDPLIAEPLGSSTHRLDALADLVLAEVGGH